MIRSLLMRSAFRSALTFGVSVPFLIAGNAFAQVAVRSPGAVASPPPVTTAAGPVTSSEPGAVGGPSPAAQPANQAGGTAETERVVVTGSNIPTAQEVGPNPVLTINRDLIEKSGERTAEELIRNLPISNANGVPISNNATGFTPGASAVSLRGFGPDATLVLIDGRRVAPFPVGAGGTTSFVDLSSIPAAAIQSIEVLKDGASTTYGADAVAGVVNVKFRHDYRGAEVRVGYGNTTDQDSSEFTSHILFGMGNETTSVNGVVTYYHRNAIFNRDRDYSAIPAFLSTNSSPLNLQLSYEAVVAAGGTPPAGAEPGDLFFGHAPFGSNGTAPASEYVYTFGRSSLFNYNEFSGSFPESERYGGFVNFNHKWFGDSLVMYGDMFYTRTKVRNELAPAATGSFNTPGQTILVIPPNAPGAVVGGPTRESVGLDEGAFNPFNPFQQVISGGSRARLAEFGNRIFDSETDAFMGTFGVKGDKLFNGTWGYDGAFRYSEIKQTMTGRLQSTSRFNRIVNANDPIFDPDSPEYIGTTIPYNPFGDYRVPIESNNATVAFATVRPKDVNVSKLATVDFTTYTTALFDLPAGGVGFAAGGQFRRESLFQDPDQINLEGDTIGSSPTAITDAGRKSYGFFAETSIPIFSSQFRMPGFYALELTAAGRFEAFKNNDSNVVVPKLGLRYQPLDDTLTFRATWGKGFRQPSLFELFSSPTAALAGATDPQTGFFDPEIPVLFSGNPDLQPEDSHTFSSGVVWTPRFIRGLTVSADVWSIERYGIVITPGLEDILDREQAGSLQPSERVERDPAGNITRISYSFLNAGSQKANGLDLGLQYQLETRFGTFTSTTNATYLNSFQFAVTADDPEEEVSNRPTDIFTSEEGYLKWRGRSRLEWSWNNITLGIEEIYTAGFNDYTPFAEESAGLAPFDHWIEHRWITDLQASYDFRFAEPVEENPVAGYSKAPEGKGATAVEPSATASGLSIMQRILNGTTITVGCRNVFDQDPPEAFGFGGNSTNYPSFLYTSEGRFVYASLNKKF